MIVYHLLLHRWSRRLHLLIAEDCNFLGAISDFLLFTALLSLTDLIETYADVQFDSVHASCEPCCRGSCRVLASCHGVSAGSSDHWNQFWTSGKMARSMENGIRKLLTLKIYTIIQIRYSFKRFTAQGCSDILTFSFWGELVKKIEWTIKRRKTIR